MGEKNSIDQECGLKVGILKNLGPASLKDLNLLGIDSLEKIAIADPEEIYLNLEKITGVKQNICMLDLFYALVHEVRTGEALPWWYWSRMRKLGTARDHLGKI